MDLLLSLGGVGLVAIVIGYLLKMLKQAIEDRKRVITQETKDEIKAIEEANKNLDLQHLVDKANERNGSRE